jgi:intracellular sulfur oxidation DsrE/DsrF family protein
LEPAVRKREAQETRYIFDNETPGRCFMFKSGWSLVLFVAALFVGVGAVYPENKADLRSDPHLHIDIPAKLDKEANVAFNIDRLALNGDMPIPLGHLELLVHDYRELHTNGRIIAIFHTDAGHVTLNDRAYNAARHVTTGNPYRGLLASLMQKGVQVELCGATARANNWGSEDLLPGVKVNTDAMVRLTQLGLEGYVQIKE